MELVDIKKFLIVEAQWGVEAGSNSVVNKVSWWLMPIEGYTLSMETCFSLTFDFGAVDGLIVIYLTWWTVSLSVLYIVQLLIFFDRDSEDEEVFFDPMADIFHVKGVDVFHIIKFDLINFLSIVV